MPPVVRVSADELRRLFNEARIEERAADEDDAEILAIVSLERDPHADANLPPGSKSQIIHYLTRDMQLVALAHRYVLPDGAIGASGRADPKKLMLEGTVYILESPSG